MKNIFKCIAFLTIIGLTMVSCDYDETNYDSLFNDIDKNASQYVQFKNAKQSFRTSVNEEGEIIDIETTVGIGLLGLPLSQDLTLDLEIDPSTTIDPEMYELSATTVTIPAGETSASVTLKTNTEEMPIDETLKLVLNIDVGEYNASHGLQLAYDLYRIDFCPITNGISDLIGAYSVTENSDGFENPVILSQEDETLLISGIGETFITGFWLEEITKRGAITMEVSGNGELTIPRQFIFATLYEGDAFEYEIEGEGVWANCGDPTIELTYDIYYIGDSDGLAKTYSSSLPTSYLHGLFTRN